MEETKKQARENNEECYQNTLVMCLAFHLLHLMLKRNDLVKMEDPKTTIIQNAKKYQMST